MTLVEASMSAVTIGNREHREARLVAPVLSTKLKLAYFPVPKIAGTSIRHCLFELDNGFPYRRMIVNGQKVGLAALCARVNSSHPVRMRPGWLKIAVVRDPLSRLVSAYQNKVLDRKRTNPKLMSRSGVASGLPPLPDLETFVANLSEYRKIKQIAHHAHPQTHFLGPTLSYFDRVFRFEQLNELETFLGERADDTITLPKFKTSPPTISIDSIPGELKRRICKLYEQDYVLLKGIYEPS